MIQSMAAGQREYKELIVNRKSELHELCIFGKTDSKSKSISFYDIMLLFSRSVVSDSL